MASSPTVIPDLNGDQLKRLREFIKQEFEKQHRDIDLTVITDWNPYSVDDVVGCLTSKKRDDKSFEIVEMDTVLLGEVVEKGVVQWLDLARFDLDDALFPAAVDAVTYKGNC